MSRQNRNYEKPESGITLIEMLLAVVIIAVFVSLLIASRDDILSKAFNSNSLRIARMLACQKMEEFLLSQVIEEAGDLAQSGTFEKYPGFSWYQTTEDISIVSETEREDNPNLQERFVTHITLTVEYENQDGVKSHYSLSTVLPRKEEADDVSR